MVSFKQVLASCVLMITSINAFSDTSTFIGTIERVLIDDVYYGGCMIQVSESISSKLPACNEGWVSLDCRSAFPETTKSIAAHKLSQAQLALVADKTVYLEVTDTRKANGYCLATRIDVIR